ncbi:MAG: hypothetical protein J6Y28_09655 [Acholeplasmatales bacterium]|nr:hypothetical protein [Methanobrevibacter sp.]MBP5446423.1 hypothetical protein [Acholeplasmatales bacterium]
MDIDFEGKGAVNAQPNGGQQGTSGNNGNPANQPDTTHLNGSETVDINGDDKNNNGNTGEGATTDDNNGGSNGEENKSNNSSTGGLEPGTEIEFDGIIYTVDNAGNVVDKEGKLFKEAKDVKAWLEENNVDDNNENDTLSIDSIREAVGIDITDENGKPVEFTNDAAGVKSYIDSVRNLQAAEIAQGAVNKLFADNPVLKQFIDYVEITGSPKGFGDIPDRSGIQLDKDNESQLEAIVRMAAKEFGNRSVSDSYIKYLKESGGLYDEAKTQLEALVGKDKAYRKEIENRAKAAREQEEQSVRNYWQSVSDAIAKKVIGGYKLPDSFVKEINGQKITYTTEDFFKYLSEPAVKDEDGNVLTGYQRDLAKLTDEEALNKELLDAWLTFTGGSYKDLIDMAIKEDAVRKLVIKSKQQRSAHTVKINKPEGSKKVDFNKILLN